MHGVEQDLEESHGVGESQRWVEQIAAHTGVECIIGTTNFRTHVPSGWMHWERYYFGSVLAATGLALGNGLGYICIPSSFSYRHQVAHGSTPLVDERYSTERTRVIHDGGEATRAQKVARILEWDRALVLKHLRVCIRNQGGAYNCGRCYKCVRTGIALRATGVWKEAQTFPDKSTESWARAAVHDHLVLTEENLTLARECGQDDDLIRLLDRIVRKQRRNSAMNVYVRNSPLEHLRPFARRARRWISWRRA
jgi:hypothetical protein